MKNNVLGLIGAQYGDEGSGKFIDLLSNEFDVIVRYQGGDNSDHTVVSNGKKHKLRLIPSGIFSKSKEVIIANGVVINLKTLLSEINYLEENGYSASKLYISNKAHIIFDYHIELDKLNEENKGNNKLGTTCRGIGPCYADKAARIGIRICDLFDKKELRNKIENALKEKNVIFYYYNKLTFNVDVLTNEYYEIGQQIKHMVVDSSIFLNNAINSDKRVLLVGAQGALLDLDHGTYPFVTSSNVTSQMAGGSGIGITKINKVLGVAKAYTTRMGTGAFATEIRNEIATYIRERGNEYDTVTKRPRRIGWLDIVALKYSINVSGINYLAITLLDVLSGLEKIKICVGYIIDGKKIDYIPPTINDYSKCDPIYVTIDGWNEDLSEMKTIYELPINCQKFLLLIQKLTGTKIKYVSVGPSKEQTIKIGN